MMFSNYGGLSMEAKRRLEAETGLRRPALESMMLTFRNHVLHNSAFLPKDMSERKAFASSLLEMAHFGGAHKVFCVTESLGRKLMDSRADVSIGDLVLPSHIFELCPQSTVMTMDRPKAILLNQDLKFVVHPSPMPPVLVIPGADPSVGALLRKTISELVLKYNSWVAKNAYGPGGRRRAFYTADMGRRLPDPVLLNERDALAEAWHDLNPEDSMWLIVDRSPLPDSAQMPNQIESNLGCWKIDLRRQSTLKIEEVIADLAEQDRTDLINRVPTGKNEEFFDFLVEHRDKHREAIRHMLSPVLRFVLNTLCYMNISDVDAQKTKVRNRPNMGVPPDAMVFGQNERMSPECHLRRGHFRCYRNDRFSRGGDGNPVIQWIRPTMVSMNKTLAEPKKNMLPDLRAENLQTDGR